MRVFHHICFILSFSWKHKCTKIGMLLILVLEMVIFFKFDELAALIPKWQIATKRSTDLNSTMLRKTENLNLHVWSETCARDLNILCNFPMFPKAPDKRLLLNNTKVTKDLAIAEAGIRLFGFILPDRSGVYVFAVKFCPAEVWLSHNEDLRNARKIWDTELKLSQGRKGFGVSDKIELIAGKRYFIEVVATCFRQRHKVQLLWKTPMKSGFEVIKGKFLSHYMNQSLNNSKIYDNLLPDSPVCTSRRNKTTYFPVQREISYLSHDQVKDILPYCDYDPSYTVNKRVKRWHAITFYAINTFVYPFPDHPGLNGNKYPLDKDEALEVSSIFMESLENQMPG